MHRYENVVELIRRRISTGLLKVGERMPSVRSLAKETGYSVLTVYHAYEILESQGVCHAKDRSGFYVATAPTVLREFPVSVGQNEGLARSIGSLPEAQLLSWEQTRLHAFGSFQPSLDLFQRENIDRIVRRVLRRGPDRNDSYQVPEADEVLRHAIALRSAQRGIVTRQSDIIIARSGMDAFNLCLDTFTQPLKTVLVESPSYFPMLASMKRRNLMAVELYSHPKFGVDPEQFEYLLRTTGVKVCILMASNHFPTGVAYSRDSMRRIVKAARDAGAIILENDMFGELGYAQERSGSLKEFDEGDTVVQFGSFATFLSPSYGLGWILAGKSAETILANQYFSGLQVGDGMIQRAIGEYLEEHSHSRHLRKVREQLAARMQRGLDLISRFFPSSCSVSQPHGGFMCWVRGPQRFDASFTAARAPTADGYTILPGALFSVEGSFSNFMALNFSFPWNAELERKIELLGAAMSDTKASRQAG